MPKKTAHSGFTIIEILVVIAMIGILAGIALKAVNPSKRLKQARDSQRKTDITAIANALVNYAQDKDGYPPERTCDTSRGAGGPNPTYCPPSPGSQLDWSHGPQTSFLHQELTKTQLKLLPVDPKNNTTYYYKYEPASASGSNCSSSGSLCFRYWIGVRLEDTEPSKARKIVFRCSDDNSLAAKAGCKEVEFLSATGANSFDDISTTR